MDLFINLCLTYGTPTTFDVQINVDGVPGKYLCYKSQTPTGNPSSGASLPTNQLITGFTEDIYLTIFLCDNANCNTNCSPTPECFKTFYIPMPDYDCSASMIVSYDHIMEEENNIIKVFPNPSKGQILADVMSEYVDYQILDVSGTLVNGGRLPTGKHTINILLPEGIYYILGNNEKGITTTTKLVIQ